MKRPKGETAAASLAGDIMRAGGIEVVDFISASGLPANRKINSDVIYKRNSLKHKAAKEVKKLLKPYKPDLLIPTPYGANRLGMLVAKKLDISCVCVEWANKTPGRKEIRIASLDDEEAIYQAEKIGIIEDVRTTGESSHAVASHPLIADKVIGVFSLWARLEAHQQIEVPYHTDAVIKIPVPLMVRGPRHG